MYAKDGIVINDFLNQEDIDMFGFLTDAVENVLDIGNDLLEGELPTKRQVAKLVDAGVSIYVISEATGLATDVIESLLDD